MATTTVGDPVRDPVYGIDNSILSRFVQDIPEFDPAIWTPVSWESLYYDMVSTMGLDVNNPMYLSNAPKRLITRMEPETRRSIFERVRGQTLTLPLVFEALHDLHPVSKQLAEAQFIALRMGRLTPVQYYNKFYQAWKATDFPPSVASRLFRHNAAVYLQKQLDSYGLNHHIDTLSFSDIRQVCFFNVQAYHASNPSEPPNVHMFGSVPQSPASPQAEANIMQIHDSGEVSSVLPSDDQVFQRLIRQTHPVDWKALALMHPQAFNRFVHTLTNIGYPTQPPSPVHGGEVHHEEDVGWSPILIIHGVYVRGKSI